MAFLAAQWGRHKSRQGGARGSRCDLEQLEASRGCQALPRCSGKWVKLVPWRGVEHGAAGGAADRPRAACAAAVASAGLLFV